MPAMKIDWASSSARWSCTPGPTRRRERGGQAVSPARSAWAPACVCLLSQRLCLTSPSLIPSAWPRAPWVPAPWAAKGERPFCLGAQLSHTQVCSQAPQPQLSPVAPCMSAPQPLTLVSAPSLSHSRRVSACTASSRDVPPAHTFISFFSLPLQTPPHLHLHVLQALHLRALFPSTLTPFLCSLQSQISGTRNPLAVTRPHVPLISQVWPHHATETLLPKPSGTFWVPT